MFLCMQRPLECGGGGGGGGDCGWTPGMAVQTLEVGEDDTAVVVAGAAAGAGTEAGTEAALAPCMMKQTGEASAATAAAALDWVPSRGALPRCPLAWPHATSCGTAWRRFVKERGGSGQDGPDRGGGGGGGGCGSGGGGSGGGGGTCPNTPDDELTRRSDKEHFAHSRRLMRLLRRARGLLGYAAGNGSEDAAVDMMPAVGNDGEGLERVHERIVRDGTVCPCARAGLIVVWRSNGDGSGGGGGGDSGGGGGGEREHRHGLHLQDSLSLHVTAPPSPLPLPVAFDIVPRVQEVRSGRLPATSSNICTALLSGFK
jgi:hypothetical protein